jgi:glycosyltransferase involved in cell wall biosynthesis
MKKILFYTESKWAFGAIHYGLCKELYKHGIYCNVLDWDLEYTIEEFKLLNDTYDLFVTTPVFVLKLHRQYGVPLNKISAIAHGQWDILLAKSQADFDFYPHLHSFAGISNILVKKCKEWNFAMLPKVVETGIHFDFFKSEIPKKLNVVGYGGAKETFNFWGEKIKRGHLVEEAVKRSNLQLKTHNFYNFNCMPSYYKSIDCLIMSSTEEAGGLPIIEAAASGRLPIGTPVGYFEEHAANGAGIIVSLDENSFVEETTEILNYYKNNSEAFQKKCLSVQEYARENFDWSKKINQWINLFQL